MSELQRRPPRRPVHYRRPVRLEADERVIPRRQKRGEIHPVLLVAMIVGPMLVAGLGALMFWLGYLT